MGNKHDQRPAAAIAGISAQLEGLDGWQISAARGVRPGKFRHGLSVEMARGGSLVSNCTVKCGHRCADILTEEGSSITQSTHALIISIWQHRQAGSAYVQRGLQCPNVPSRALMCLAVP